MAQPFGAHERACVLTTLVFGPAILSWSLPNRCHCVHGGARPRLAAARAGRDPTNGMLAHLVLPPRDIVLALDAGMMLAAGPHPAVAAYASEDYRVLRLT